LHAFFTDESAKPGQLLTTCDSKADGAVRLASDLKTTFG
jgi:hypothetical protein